MLAELYKNPSNNLEQTVIEYQQTNDPVCFSFVFCKLFPHMLWRTQNFYMFSPQDKASYCVEQLLKAMTNFDPQKNVKIKTLFDKYLMNKLQNELKFISTSMRKINNETVKLDEDCQIVYMDANLSNVDFLESLKKLSLNDSELRYCQLVMRGEVEKDSEIARIIGISPAAINYIRSRLRQKLTINFSSSDLKNQCF